MVPWPALQFRLPPHFLWHHRRRIAFLWLVSSSSFGRRLPIGLCSVFRNLFCSTYSFLYKWRSDSAQRKSRCSKAQKEWMMFNWLNDSTASIASSKQQPARLKKKNKGNRLNYSNHRKLLLKNWRSVTNNLIVGSNQTTVKALILFKPDQFLGVRSREKSNAESFTWWSNCRCV